MTLDEDAVKPSAAWRALQTQIFHHAGIPRITLWLARKLDKALDALEERKR